MNEKLKDQDILLVKEEGNSEIKSVDKNGETKKVKPDNAHNPDLVRFDKSGNIVGNFLENFMRQVKEPTRFEFFRVPAEKFDEVMLKLQEAFKDPEKKENKETINLYRVDTADFLKNRQQTQKQTQKEPTIHPDLVYWDKFEKYGITREGLEKSGNLEKLLDYQKTNLMPVNVKFEDETLRTDARFSLRKQEDGTFSPKIHLVKHEPELERPYFGIRFTEEDKQNLLKTGNLGRVVEVEFKQGEKVPVLLSLDKLTNELTAFRKEWLKVPDVYKGVQLSEEQKQKLSNGEKVKVEGMTSVKGKTFDGEVQFNADKRFFELVFDNSKKQSNKQNATQNETNAMRIPKQLLGADLTKKQMDNLKAGETVYVSGMKDRQGQEFNAYVKINTEKNKLDFFKWNPDKAQKQGAAEVTPDNAHKTQVAKNNDGNSTEENKKVNGSLKSGQTHPTEKQLEKEQQEKQKRRKVKM
jgi:primosomal replication protein N